MDLLIRLIFEHEGFTRLVGWLVFNDTFSKQAISCHKSTEHIV